MNSPTHGDTRDEYEVWSWVKLDAPTRLTTNMWFDWTVVARGLKDIQEARRVRTKLMTEEGLEESSVLIKHILWRADTVKLVS